MDSNAMTEGLMPGPDGCILRFFYDSVKNEAATVNTGRAIFDTVLSVDVITPGQKSSTPRFELERIWSQQSREAANILGDSKKSYKYKDFAEQIERFKRQEAVGEMGGTPLKMWPRIDRALAATLMAANVYTVEQLSALSDTNLQVIGMGARELREQAKAWLENANGTADLSALTSQVENFRQEIDDLKASLALANNQNAALQKQIAAQPEAKTLKDITLG